MKHFWRLLIFTILTACQPVLPPTQARISTPIAENVPTTVPTPESPIRYELRQPQPDELLKMIDSVLLMEEQMTYHAAAATLILEREPGTLHNLIGKDFQRYYLAGFPGAEELVVGDSLPWDLQSFGDLGSFSPILQIGLLQYVNSHQDVLEDNVPFSLPNANIRTFSMDLDGDGTLEWLIGAEYHEYSLQNWLLLKKDEGGHYRFVPSFSYGFAGIQQYTTDIEVHDLTGDGNPEIAKIQHYYLAGGMHGGIEVYSWREGELAWLKSIDLPGVPPIHGERYASDYLIDDFDGDGINDIRVNWPRFRRFDCRWLQLSTYYLDGRSPDVEIEGEEIPQTDECLIARALEADHTEEQIQFYQRALGKFDPNAMPSDQLAWLRLQLMIAYTAIGDEAQGTSQLRELMEMDGDGKFLKFIKAAYTENNSPSPLVLCDILYSAIESQEIPDNLGSEIDADLAHWLYPVDYAPLPELICPFPDTLGRRLEVLKIPVSESPIDVLTEQGYSFLWMQSLNWDNDSDQEWVGILNFHQPTLVFMNADVNWHIKTIETYSPGLSEVYSTVYLPEDNSGLSVLILLSSQGKYCQPPNAEKWLLMVTPETDDQEEWYLCDANTYSLTSKDDIRRTLQEFSKPQRYEPFEVPDWYYLSEISKVTLEQKSILEAVGELERSVLVQTDPGETASSIFALMQALPEDDPAARLLLNRLYYLRGLNYELNGQAELAVEAYLELVAFSPESLWSRYVRVRLYPPMPP